MIANGRLLGNAMVARLLVILLAMVGIVGLVLELAVRAQRRR